MIKKISLLYNTVKHLKPIQVFYQFKYRLNKAGKLSTYTKTYSKDAICFLSFCEQPPVYKGYLGKNNFSFLNLEVRFNNNIDWNYQEHGKLWNYNLQYANYLLQEEVPLGERKCILLSLYESLNSGYLPLEPYPVSLRSINCIRFLSHNKIVDSELTSYLHGELDFLTKRLEYHLLGNHLLENAFALLMGGAFFSNQKWTELGQKILLKELKEQTLQDGAHFELSPMYHQIIFFRLLELIDWYKQWEGKQTEFLSFLENKASLMLSWLDKISFENGDIPHFNDSAEGISYSTQWLKKYATLLSIPNEDIALGESGYRSININKFELRIDFAQISSSYQPGHAHADNLSFILHYSNQPIIVDTGTSTYENNKRRSIERSTTSHNTVTINKKNSSQIWSGFRVGKRAKTKIKIDKEEFLEAFHNGYHTLKHLRRFQVKNQNIVITDRIDLAKSSDVAEGHLHFHPDVIVSFFDNIVLVNNEIKLHVNGAKKLELIDYKFALGYNKLLPSKKLVYHFDKEISLELIKV